MFAQAKEKVVSNSIFEKPQIMTTYIFEENASDVDVIGGPYLLRVVDEIKLQIKSKSLFILLTPLVVISVLQAAISYTSSLTSSSTVVTYIILRGY